MKMIIKNQADITDEEALQYVLWVVKMGKVSNNNTQYAYLSRWQGIMVDVIMTKKGTHTFLIYRDTK